MFSQSAHTTYTKRRLLTVYAPSSDMLPLFRECSSRTLTMFCKGLQPLERPSISITIFLILGGGPWRLCLWVCSICVI